MSQRNCFLLKAFVTTSSLMHVSRARLRLRTRHSPLHPPCSAGRGGMKPCESCEHVRCAPTRGAGGLHLTPTPTPPLRVDFAAGVSYINITANVPNVPSCQDLTWLKYYSESQNIHGKMSVIRLWRVVCKKLLCWLIAKFFLWLKDCQTVVWN